ncbi:MAG: cytochrome c maturation protein CcmE, partial [SAR202 cluster bacterium]|nr:cytochrome c maturation protein CcmE [SAR202 cluster bacterium]
MSAPTYQATEQPPQTEEGVLARFRGRLLIGGVLLVAALVYFAYTAFQGSTVYYYTVGELVGHEPSLMDKPVRVSGKLVAATFSREAGSTLAWFSISDGAVVLPAQYNGVVPDLFFNEHSDIVLQGVYRADGSF